MTSQRTRFTIGVDDPVIKALADRHSESAWLAEALEAFFQAFGLDDLGEPSTERKQAVTYSARLPEWAQDYMERIGVDRPKLIRAAAWFYLGQKSVDFDIQEILEELKQVIARSPDLEAPLGKEEQALLDTLTSQF